MKLYKIIGGMIISLLILRLCLPYILIRYAENRINQIPQYKVKIGDLDVHLIRGSYTIKDIALQKVNKNIPVPFFKAKAIDLSIEWRAILRGAFVAKIIAINPEVNFVIDAKGKNQQLSIDDEWQRAVKALFPLNFNRVEIQHGKLTFRNFNGRPPFNIYLKDINFTIRNMQKISRQNEVLSSDFVASAKTMDGAETLLDGHFDPFAKRPTFKINGAVKSMQIKEANNFLRHFTNVDVKQGKFSLFVEMAAANGNLKGYAKPIVKDLQILNPEKPMDPIEFLYKGALELISKIVTNPEKETIATKINIEGSVDDPDTSILSIIGYTLRHAFIQALLPQVDHSIQMRDVIRFPGNISRR